MKLTAMDDRWANAQVQDSKEEARNFAQQQANKHAQDVCRVIASVTRGELETSGTICESLRGTPTFLRAAAIWIAAFTNKNSPPVLSAMRNWSSEDFEIIRGLGNSWFA
jgi:hypothetical protein